MNSMIKRRINEKYDKGLMHAIQGTYKPNNIWGVFLRAYKQGHSAGSSIGKQARRLTDFKK